LPGIAGKMSRVLAVLKENPRGLTVTGVSKAVGMNRNSAAKYLEMLVIAGRVDVRRSARRRCIMSPSVCQ
jgi:DNA-binding IclR family transcriptional regulator